MKRKLAIALSYDETIDTAPVVSAIGQEEIAQFITRLARRLGVPIVRHKNLAFQLSKLTIKEEIPNQLYRDVAELLYLLREKPVDIS